jgi:predicted ester cyclase
MGAPPTGKHVRFTGVTISRISEGRIAEDWTSYDALGMMRQLGLIPTPDGAADS